MPETPSRVVRFPVCIHCNYDLSGIAPSGDKAKCPECGEWTDIRERARPARPRWVWPVAVLAGTGTMVLGFFVDLNIRFNLPRSNRDLEALTAVACVLLGGAVSHGVMLRCRLERLRWHYKTRDLPARALRTLLVDFFCDCVVNVVVLLALGLSVFIAVRLATY